MTDTYRYENADAKVSVTTTVNVVKETPAETIEPYVTIPLVLIQSGLTPIAKIVYARIKFYQGKNDYAYPAIKSIARECNVSDRGARNAINELEKTGWLNVRHQYDQRGLQIHYSVNSSPAKFAERSARFAYKNNQTNPASLRSPTLKGGKGQFIALRGY